MAMPEHAAIEAQGRKRIPSQRWLPVVDYFLAVEDNARRESGAVAVNLANV